MNCCLRMAFAAPEPLLRTTLLFDTLGVVGVGNDLAAFAPPDFKMPVLAFVSILRMPVVVDDTPPDALDIGTELPPR